MFIFIGIAVVLGGVLTGFVLEGGQILALNQPMELLIIGGAAVGALLISTPLNVIKAILGQLKGVALGGGFAKKDYLELLVMMFEVFNVARKDGLIGLENHVEHPEQSEIFKRYPRFLKNKHAVAFFVDTMRVIISGAVQPHDLEDLMDNDIDAMHEEEMLPSQALGTTADSLPGLGIVAAVLGVVITMAAIDGPPEEIGHKIAAALVGTFLGVLGCYGFVGPLSNSLKHRVAENKQYINCMKHALLSFNKGVAGVIAVEFARRTLFADVRPGFTELENACNAAKKR
ncbi:MAG: flagellar motor stator protein MotA [Candidatus Zixiibacteriota bacterium]|nr:MAG: flagellar motor stator protein MotA [candidate division Zixibacteria bacterium]